MNWLAVLPLIVDLVKAASKLLSEIPDEGARRDAKDDLRAVLNGYADHGDVSTLRSNLEQLPASWKPHLRER